MPLDPMYYDPMVKPFRDMMAEVDSKGLTGPDVDSMRACLQEMLDLAQQTDDIAAYSGQLVQRGTFQRFSDAYGRALSAEAAANATNSGDDDQAMLAQALQSYEDALATYRSGAGGPAGQLLAPVLEKILEIGRSGVSYPVFLRMVEEKGLNRALDGTAPATRAGIEADLAFARKHWDRYGTERIARLIEQFDAMANTAAFGQPDPLAFSFVRRRLEWEYIPMEKRWEAEVSRWQYLLDMLVDWVDSYTSFAPYDQRWRPPGATEEDVRRNIQRTQECSPGEFRYREQLYLHYFGKTWEQIWESESFIWEYSANRISWSDERLQLVRDTYHVCHPDNRPPQEFIRRAEALHPAKDIRPEQGAPPPWGSPLRRPPVTDQAPPPPPSA